MIAMLHRQFETRIANILKVAACRHTVVMKGLYYFAAYHRYDIFPSLYRVVDLGSFVLSNCGVASPFENTSFIITPVERFVVTYLNTV